MKRILASTLFILTLAAPAVVSAQTGPVGSRSVAAPAPVVAGLTKDQVQNKMREVGFEVLGVQDYEDGAFLVTSRYRQGDWQYAIEIYVGAKGGYFWVRSQLSDLPGGPIAANGLIRLLEQNKRNPGTMFFQIDSATRKIELAQPFTNPADINSLGTIASRFCDVIKNNYDLWRPEAFTGGAVATK